MPCALVTGSSRGIGRGIALALAADGWHVVVNYCGNQQAAEDTCAAVRQAGGQALKVQGDVALAADRQRLVDESVQWTGAIDLLVNNAGIAPSVRAEILEADEESFDRLLQVNLKGPYFLTQVVARQMLQQESRGQIINVTSVSAYAPSINRGDYCISKAGLGMMTALFAARLADDGIRVYEIRPGVIATDMTGGVKEKYDRLIAEGLSPIKRWGQAEDVGRAVRAIARGDLPFSTGEVINVDGGFHLKIL
ncbi:MAG: 3-ketoacyl-ACP reductase [Planctomycetota bacterium]|nr:MAG: 3-ketoacyl-ACP reductase [Planctomycetota bacterium]